MNINKKREVAIEKLLDFMIYISWVEKYGRSLIKENQLKLNIDMIEKVALFLNEFIYTIHLKGKILMPMGYLFKNGRWLEESRYFYFTSVAEEIGVVGLKIKNPLDLSKLQTKNNSKKILIKWFSKLQIDPSSIKSDLQNARDIIGKK